MKPVSDAPDQATRQPSPGKRVLAELAGMSPAYFGMDMATGIVSLGAHFVAWPRIAQMLFQLNVVAYAVLGGLSMWRAVAHTRRFFGDMVDHLRGPGFFTTVAATAILGGQFILLGADLFTGTALWALATLLWVGLTYIIFAGFTIKEDKPTLDKCINGAWLLAVVATQSIAALSALMAPQVGQPGKLELNFLALSMWLWGGMLYIWMMSLIFYRYTFFRLAPSDLTPPYWINMGAMAISTLAGSLLIINVSDAPFLLSLLPFIKGFTVLYWATGTWWIPMLLVLALWRHVYKRFPMTYDPLYWGALFPLGMNSASTDRMIEAVGFSFLTFLPVTFFYAALVAWSIVFLGLVRDLLRRARGFWR